MAHIGIDTEDLTLLSNDIEEMKSKLDGLKQKVNSQFKVSKDYELYLEGFEKLNDYLDSKINEMESFKTKVKDYKSEIDNIEGTYIDKFSDITVPNFESNGSGLSIVNPSTFVQQEPVVDNNEPTKNENVSNYLNNNTANVPSGDKKDGNGFNVLGAVAGIVGAVGIGGAIAAASLKKDEDEKEKDKDNNEVREY